LSTAAAKLRHLFNFHLLRHLQPSTHVTSFNFNPRRHFIPLQIQSSLPTSSLVSANFNHRRLSISKPRCYAISSPSLMMPTVCLMLLLPYELLTKIIIHSINYEPVFHFLNLRTKICSTFRRICN
jgi:hypothetical protein